MFEILTTKKGYPLLLLAVAALLQTLCYMSVLSGNPFPMIDSGIATALYFLFPLLYFGTKLTYTKKRYFIGIISTWSIYFILYTAIFVLHLSFPYWFDKPELLCFILLGITLYYSLKERKTNSSSRQFLTLFGMLSAGFALLFLVTTMLNMPLSQTIIGIFKEAFTLYCRPLLFWIFTTVLFALFILAAWDFLQEKINSAKQMERMQGEQSILNFEIEATKNQLDSLRSANEQTRIYRHDMRHHLSLLSSFITDGNIQKAKDYILSAKADINAVTPIRYCENETMNLIFSSFADKANKLGVSMSVDAQIPKVLALPDTELCSVLSNGLENAITAASLPSENCRSIRIICKLNRDKLLVFIENTCVGKVELSDGLPKTNKDGHGFGTKSMKALAKKRNGDCICESVEGLFTLRVVLPLDK